MARKTAVQPIVCLDAAQAGQPALEMRRRIGERFVGQVEAVNAVAGAYQRWKADLCRPGRPIASLLFLGPSGTGKTHLVETFAYSIHRLPRHLLKIDCAEYQHSHEVARLVGAPPGYLGHRETAAVLRQKTLNEAESASAGISVILLDEVDKAHEAFWNILLGILDKGILQLGDSSKTDFSRSMIFMTANTGSREIGHLLHGGFGFTVPEASTSSVSGVALSAMRRVFAPEFVNRLDGSVVFHPLSRPQLLSILEFEIETLRPRLSFSFDVSERAREFLADQGYDARYGARHLRRSVDQHLVQPFTNLICSNQVALGDRVFVGADDKGLTYTKAMAA